MCAYIFENLSAPKMLNNYLINSIIAMHPIDRNLWPVLSMEFQ